MKNICVQWKMKNGRWREKLGHSLPHAPAARTEPPQLNRYNGKSRRSVSRSASASLKD
ncbi:MAG TPA: hypothetical protein PKW18_12495 [Candidatus Sumerlaeota bacterium]|nr:hypothetical protein [Candidatus Sumerlaeota bacterium]HRR31771.1 hypothetical protein [Candidatus Sumerlaeia bacterium]HON50779.1 hypothetical protein [Candidatus Sumerlaeota bacterium]HOR65473.1 hypothetical protein [Candidatus Sumerlaeota bacterium]HPL75374.1 hypothetical protein [Candidatus Sumerlaeota bacterium]